MAALAVKGAVMRFFRLAVAAVNLLGVVLSAQAAEWYNATFDRDDNLTEEVRSSSASDERALYRIEVPDGMSAHVTVTRNWIESVACTGGMQVWFNSDRRDLSGTTSRSGADYYCSGEVEVAVAYMGQGDVYGTTRWAITGSFTISVAYSPAFPDLVVKDIAFVPSDPVVGELAVVRCTVRNSGDASSPWSTVRVFQGTRQLAECFVPTLPRHGEAEVVLELPDLPVGSHPLKVSVDQVDNESGTDNNEKNVVCEIHARTPYTVRFDANGGSGSMPPQAFVCGTPQPLSGNRFSREGYAFAGWSSDPLAERGAYEDGETVDKLTFADGGEVTLYAIWWKENTEDLYYEIAGGEVTITGARYDFTGALVIPARVDGYPVTRIAERAFAERRNPIINVVLPPSVKDIGDQAFYFCDWLESVEMPGVTHIGLGAFRSCSSLKTVTIPKVEIIGEDAFAFASYKLEVTIPSCTREIGRGAFEYALKSVTIEEGVSKIGDYAFFNTSLRTIEIPASVRSIGQDVFAWSKLETVKIRPGVTNIGQEAFYSCENLKSISIPYGVESIGERAFDGCRSLEEISLPATVRHLGTYALFTDGKDVLQSVRLKGNVPESMDGAVFPNYNYTIYVPRGSTGWGVDIPGSWQGRPINYYFSTPYEIAYDLDGGTHGAFAPGFMDADDEFFLAAPTCPGRVFAGWTVTGELDPSTATWGTGPGPDKPVSSSSVCCVNGERGNVFFKGLARSGNCVTLKANWSTSAGQPQAYSISYRPGSFGFGPSVTKQKANDAALVLEGAIFSRVGYSQTGWSLREDGGTRDYGLSAVYSDNAPLTLYPHWTANVYAVHYQLGGGSNGSSHPDSATYDSPFAVSAPVRAGFTFAGWSVIGGLDPVTARWGTILGQGQPIADSTVKCQNGVTDDVHFRNLTAAADGTVTLAAKWCEDEKRTRTVSFSPGVYGTGVPSSISKFEDETLTLAGAVFSRFGYTQTGWSADEYGSSKDYDLGSSYSGSESTTLYPYWTANAYSVCYALNGGSFDLPQPDITRFDVEFSVSPPVRSGYSFEGWTVTSGLDPSTALWRKSFSILTRMMYGITSSSQVCGNGETGVISFMNLTTADGGSVTLTANWKVREKQVYSIAYGSGAYSSEGALFDSKTEDATLVLKGAVFTRTGYTQTGWSLRSDGATKDYELSGTYSDNAAQTFYPHWTANTYSITYSLGGGSFGANHPNSATYDSPFAVSAPTRSGYTFEGWTVEGFDPQTASWGTTDKPMLRVLDGDTKCANGDSGDVYFQNLTAAAGGRVTLWAKWLSNDGTYAITYVKNGGGTVSSSGNPTRYSEADLPIVLYPPEGYDSVGSSLFRSGSHFAGWTPCVIPKGTVGDVTIVGKFSDLPLEGGNPYYIVAFDANGGTGEMEPRVLNKKYPSSGGHLIPMTPIGFANAFVREGFEFVGWALSSDGMAYGGESERALYEDVPNYGILKLFAIWREEQVDHVVTYCSGDESLATVLKDVKRGGSPLALREGLFTRSGYVQAGWSKQPDGATRDFGFGEAYAVDDDQTLYPYWVDEGSLDKVTYAPGDLAMTAEPESVVKLPGVSLALRDALFKRTGYSQTGWSRESSGRSLDLGLGTSYGTEGSSTLYPYWVANTYSIAYLLGEGTHGAVHPSSVAFDSVFEISAPARTGYAFAGWTVREGLDPSTAKWGMSSNPELAIPDSAARCFNGASGSVYFLNLTAEDGGGVMLQAEWTANSYSIDYLLDGGSHGAVHPVSATFDSAFEVSDPVRSGYSFEGWTVSGLFDVRTAKWGEDSMSWKEITDSGMKCGSAAFGSVHFKNLTAVAGGRVTLTANWVKPQSAVTYHPGSSGEGDPITVMKQRRVALALLGETFTRTGYTQIGWSTSDGGTKEYELCESYGADVAIDLYPVWAANTYRVEYALGAGAEFGAEHPEAATYDEPFAVAPPTRPGHEFSGWVVTQGLDLSTAIWGAYGRQLYVETTEAGSGSGSVGSLRPSIPSKTLYLYPFVSAEELCKHQSANVYFKNLTPSPNGCVVLTAVWTAIPYDITYDLNGGVNAVGNPSRFTVLDLPIRLGEPTREGFRFLGWSPNGGVIPVGTTGDVTFSAQWEEIAEPPPVDPEQPGEPDQTDNPPVAPPEEPVEPEEPVGPTTPTNVPPTVVDEAETHVDVEKGEVAPYVDAASVYDGFLYEGGKVAGSVQVKVAKMKNGEAKVTATVQMAGQAKKLNFKGGVADATGKVTHMSGAGHELDITVGVNGLGRTFRRAGDVAPYQVDGARNVFSGKSAADKTAASEAVRLYQGVYNVAFDGGTLSVSVDKKGKAKIAGTVEGNKVSATSQLVVGKDAAVVPVVITKKVNVAFCLWVMANGTVEARGIEGAIAGKAGTLKAGAKFVLDVAAAKGLAALPGLYGEYLPNGIDVAASGTKWIVAGGVKAGKVAFVKGGNTIDESKLGKNPSGLKLTYKQKDGTFKGSFKAYNLEISGKIKAYTASVTGVMIGAKGYGTATIKKPACTFLITIE